MSGKLVSGVLDHDVQYLRRCIVHLGSSCLQLGRERKRHHVQKTSTCVTCPAPLQTPLFCFERKIGIMTFEKGKSICRIEHVIVKTKYLEQC